MENGKRILKEVLILTLALNLLFSPANAFPRAHVTITDTEETPTALLESPGNNVTYALNKQGQAVIPLRVYAPDNKFWQVEKVELFANTTDVNKITELAKTARVGDKFAYNWTVASACIYKVIAKVSYKHRTKNDATDTSEPAAMVIVSPYRAPSNSSANGIFVGQTKVFDERSLALKLQSVEASLANRNFFDQASLASAIGRLQGAQQNTSSLGVSVTGMPVPGVTTVDKSSVSEVTKPAGTETTKNNSTDVTTTEAAVTPGAPALPGQTPALTSQLAYNVAAQDLLAEQMSLTHQVINLRMLLERALSDRVSANTTNSFVRKSAVIGFQISVDPQKAYKNAVAEVDITITSSCPTNQPSSLVALFPKDKTYNVATITKDAKQFGFGAVLQVVSAGVSYGNTKDTFYLVRDTDTVALERAMPWEASAEAQNRNKPCRAAASDEETEDEEASFTSENSITFGWQFRPVLKRKFIEPGTR